MLDNYLIIHKSILPDYYEKVLLAKRMIEDGTVKEVSQAVKIAGISRSTYYKYKDYILQPSSLTAGHRAVLSAVLSHETGVLSSLLALISEAGASVLTITQSLPIHGKASVTLSIDVTDMTCPVSQLVSAMENCSGVEKPRLVAIE